MKKLLTFLFAGMLSTSILMAGDTTKSTEKTHTQPAKTKTHKSKAPKTEKTQTEKPKETEQEKK